MGAQAELSCIVKGSPMPNVSWKKDGRTLYDGRQYRCNVRTDGTATLTINSVEADDGGEYTVEAVNDYGKDRKSVNFTVNGQWILAAFKMETCS